MIAYIDEHRDRYGVEPICTQLPIAPSTLPRREGASSFGPSAARRRAEASDRPGARGELRGLRWQEGMAAAQARGDQRRPVHGAAPDG